VTCTKQIGLDCDDNGDVNDNFHGVYDVDDACVGECDYLLSLSYLLTLYSLVALLPPH
jgi:hypothetical protein